MTDETYKTLNELKAELKEICKKTNTRQSGIQKLVDYYIKYLDWSERQAIEYTLGLFRDGTIEQIKLLGKDGEYLCER